jgi:hypothetical protein
MVPPVGASSFEVSSTAGSGGLIVKERISRIPAKIHRERDINKATTKMALILSLAVNRFTPGPYKKNRKKKKRKNSENIIR